MQDKPPITNKYEVYSKALGSSFPNQMGAGGRGDGRRHSRFNCRGIGPSPGADLCTGPLPDFWPEKPSERTASTSSLPTTGTELLAKGQVGGEERGGTTPTPAPTPSPLLGFGPCPQLGCAMPKAAVAPISVPAGAPGAPHPLPAPPGPRRDTRQSVPRAPTPLFPEPRDQQAAVGAAGPGTAWRERAATAPSHLRSLLRSRAC